MSAFGTQARPTQLPRETWVIVLLVAAAISATWFVSGWTAADYNDLLMMQLAGAAPTDAFLFLALSGVMMAALMLPSVMPIVAAYRRHASAEAGGKEGRARTWILTAGYSSGRPLVAKALCRTSGLWRKRPGQASLLWGPVHTSDVS